MEATFLVRSGLMVMSVAGLVVGLVPVPYLPPPAPTPREYEDEEEEEPSRGEVVCEGL